jgi:cell division septum initiation protein DivIVA
MILASPRIPLTGKTLVDEDLLLDQLDAIRLSLPDAFAKALEILGRQEEIVMKAEDYGQQLINESERVAARMLKETGIIQQAQREAEQLRKQVQQECQQLRQATLDEIDELRQDARRELDQMRATAFADCQEIESGADDYADAVLNNLEDQLVTMLRVIQNGRKRLETEVQPQQPPQGS